MKVLSIAVGLVVVATACALPPGEDLGEDESTTTTDGGIIDPQDGPIDAAIADLAEMLGVDSDTITVASQFEVTWPDGSLGCPQPGTMYIQRLVNGSLIVLEAGGRHYEYHAGPAGDPFYCANPSPPVLGGGGLGDT